MYGVFPFKGQESFRSMSFLQGKPGIRFKIEVEGDYECGGRPAPAIVSPRVQEETLHLGASELELD